MRTITAIFILLSFSALSVMPRTPSDDVMTAGANKDVPADFKSDGCTMWPDGDYRTCCEAHDLDYYYGGTKADRMASDLRLRDCVRATGHKHIARMMYIGVRVAGGAWLRAPFSWGFGRN